jgi:hypothetical protein
MRKVRGWGGGVGTMAGGGERERENGGERLHRGRKREDGMLSNGENERV